MALAVSAPEHLRVDLQGRRRVLVTDLRLPSSPLVAVRFVFRAGSQDDPKGKEGLAALTAAMVAEGGTKELAYDDQGSGVPVIFLHGLTFSRATWAPIIERLGNSVRTVAIDLPGHGDSRSKRGSRSG